MAIFACCASCVCPVDSQTVGRMCSLRLFVECLLQGYTSRSLASWSGAWILPFMLWTSGSAFPLEASCREVFLLQQTKQLAPVAIAANVALWNSDGNTSGCRWWSRAPFGVKVVPVLAGLTVPYRCWLLWLLHRSVLYSLPMGPECLFCQQQQLTAHCPPFSICFNVQCNPARLGTDV